MALPGPDGLLEPLAEMVAEAALDEELNEHPGHELGDPHGRNRADQRPALGEVDGAEVPEDPVPRRSSPR